MYVNQYVPVFQSEVTLYSTTCKYSNVKHCSPAAENLPVSDQWAAVCLLPTTSPSIIIIIIVSNIGSHTKLNTVTIHNTCLHLVDR